MESRVLLTADGTGAAGYWAFDAGDVTGSTVIDRSGNEMHGRLVNGPRATAGKAGKALQFDGINDYVNLGNLLPSGGSAMSAAAWVYKKDSGRHEQIISKASDTALAGRYIWSLGVTPDSKVRVRLRIGSTTFSIDGPTISPRQWHHLAFSYDGARVRVYVDGGLVATHARRGTIPASDVSAVIGNNDAGISNRYFNGKIDEVRVYGRALTGTEVAALYRGRPLAAVGAPRTPYRPPEPPRPTSAPSSPSTLTATAASGAQINLSWTDNSSNEIGFKVERSTDGTNFTPIAAVVGANTYAAVGLRASTQYHFRVRAYNAAGVSTFSNVASATTQAALVMPDASNTGYRGTLTTVRELYTASANEVIENKLFLDGVIVPAGAHNVVIRNCKITGGRYGIRSWDGARNLLIEDVEIDGSAAPAAIDSKGIVGYNFTIRRCNIHHTGSDGIQVVGGDTLIEHNYIHHVSYGGWNGGNPNWDHADGIQLTSGGDNHLWRFNNIHLPASGYARDPWGALNSCMTMQFTDLTSFTMEGNWLYGGGYTIRLEPNGKTMTGGIIKDNKLGPKQGPDVIFGPLSSQAQITATNNRYSYPGAQGSDGSLAFGGP